MGDVEDEAHFRFKGMKKGENESREERARQEKKSNHKREIGEKIAEEERRMRCSRLEQGVNN